MLKGYLLVALVICSHSIYSILAADDEFAEFDDLSTDEVIQFGNIKSEEFKKPIVTNEPSKDPASNLETERARVPDEPLSEDEKSKSEKKPDLKLVNAPLPRIYTWESYYIEIAFLLASFLYFVNFFLGSNTNSKLAHQWYSQSRGSLIQQFALVGGSPQISDGGKKREEDNEVYAAMKKQKGLIKSTESMYTLWCSGRIGVDGLLVEINLLKRQDLFSMSLNLLKLTKDNLILHFLMNQDGYDNFVFCLSHKNHAQKLAKEMVDINTFCPKRKPLTQCGVDVEKFFVMSELSDATSFILDRSTASFLKKYEHSLNYIHITDKYSIIQSEEILPAQRLANSKRMATFSFHLPTESTDDGIEFLQFALSLLDRLRRFKLARDSKQKSEKNRQKINDIIQKAAFSQRQEAAQAKKEEQRRLEKERIYNEEDPEKQRMWEKKEAKRELKKNKMRVKQLKVKSM